MTPDEHGALLDVVSAGIDAVSKNLSAMVGQPIEVSASAVSMVPVRSLADFVGGPAAAVVGIYLGVSGDLQGHLILFLVEPQALKMADLLWENLPGTATQLDAGTLSALAEAGNVAGSAFLNTLADRASLVIVPSAPSVLMDMAGAILSVLQAELLLVAEEAMVIETEFSGSVRGVMMLLPDPDSLSKLLLRLRPPA